MIQYLLEKLKNNFSRHNNNNSKRKLGQKLAIVFFACLGFYFLTPSQNIAANFNDNPKNYNVNLQILDKNNIEIALFQVAIANSDAKKAYGLMNLKSLPQNHGMLFLFDQSQQITMWMKNTLIPLDMVFIDQNNIITHIAKNTKPLSLEHIYSQQSCNKVLEINGGVSDKLKINIGDKVKFKL